MSENDDVGDQESQLEPTTGFDRYRSLLDPAVTIVVAKDVVPPFRFKAGGWELLQSSLEPGSAIKARIAEKGLFLFRINEDLTGGVELSDPQTQCSPDETGRKAEAEARRVTDRPAPPRGRAAGPLFRGGGGKGA